MLCRIPFFRRICLWTWLLLLAPGATYAESREYQIKAAFLVNFLQFVTWPANTFASDDTPFRIGVLGDDPFGTTLDEIVRGETVNHHKIVVQRGQRVEDCKGCQMIFVSRSQEKNLPSILADLDSGPVLTVGEVRGFARKGGIINFYTEGNKVRFEINAMVAQRDKLKMSAQLLSLGKIIESPEGGK
jgi:hypothetical protein